MFNPLNYFIDKRIKKLIEIEVEKYFHQSKESLQLTMQSFYVNVDTYIKKLDDYFNSEKIIDIIIERINKKQLGGKN